ncbi:hypothetical protein CS053_08840 [Rhodanobacter glycinis]|uniref:Uncharacterized protein n=1 Tax=Rhodanobacter glycinis TaxID=582702 RepID=A0A5B9DYE1_9GAMM|nr:hypothetical protein [Rhodanobacter glycinis]QEE24598.1 hypothetical protein CS053_08840 [Rhodanobacter glycinis]
MTNLTPSASFDSVQELETTTVALGGPGAPMNVQAQALLNRTQYLFVQLSNLAPVATSGDYNSLINRPALGSAAYQSSGAFATAAQGAKADGAAQASALSSVAFSGSYNDLSNKLFASDAPSDGNVYGRKNGAWSIAIEGLGVGVELNNTLQWTANQSIAPTMLTSGTTIPVDASTSNNFALVMTGDCKLSNPTNLKQGMVLNFTIDQDTTGGHAITTDTLYVFENGTPLWNTAASGKNFFSGYYDGTVIRCFSGATVSTQVNSDWNASSGVAQILNKPTLGTASAQNVSYFATAAQGSLAATAVQQSTLGIANGTATLGSDGTLASSEIPTSLLGQVDYQGTWDASTGSPPTASPAKGEYWIVSVAGSTSLSGITTWNIGDWAIYDTQWDKVNNTDAVSSVAGLVGIISTASLQSALGLGSAAYTALSAYATASQGTLAGTALQPDAGGQLLTTARRRKIVALGNITGDTNIDLASGDIITGTLTGNVTLIWVNLPPSGYAADTELRLTQDATGSHTVTWAASTKWPGGSAYVITPTASAMDVVGFTVDSEGASIGYPVEAVA